MQSLWRYDRGGMGSGKDVVVRPRLTGTGSGTPWYDPPVGEREAMDLRWYDCNGNGKRDDSTEEMVAGQRSMADCCVELDQPKGMNRSTSFGTTHEGPQQKWMAATA